MATAAVFGTGIMGSAIARNLLAAGFDVRVWNRSRKPAEALADDGARIATSPGEAAGQADFVITVLPDADTTAEVLDGDALLTLRGGAVWIQVGTVGTAGTEKLAALAERTGVHFVDAPVLGTKEPAENGELVVLASGPDEVRERVDPVFDVIGKKTMWLGPAGAGSRLKLVTNEWIVGLLATLSETIGVARSLDVDPADFLTAIRGGALDSAYGQTKGKMMINADYPASAPLKHIRKDAGLVIDAVDDVPTRVAQAAAAYFDAAMASGHGDDDMAAIYEGVRNNKG